MVSGSCFFIAFAMAMAGKICPPVPPPGILVQVYQDIQKMPVCIWRFFGTGIKFYTCNTSGCKYGRLM